MTAHKGFDALEHFKTHEGREVFVLQAMYFFSSNRRVEHGGTCSDCTGPLPSSAAKGGPC